MKKSSTYPAYFLFPALGLYGMLFLIPGVTGLFYSFTDWSGYSDTVNFIGLENFATVFSPHEQYFSALGNTIRFTVATTILKTGLGVLMALLLNEAIPFRNIHRAVLFMPSILSLIVVGLVFKSVLNPETGILNTFLRFIGADVLARGWLVEPQTAFGSIIFVDVWKGLGYITTVLLAALQTIPKSYYEAVSLDGANRVQSFAAVTLPFLRPAIMVSVVLNVLYGLKVFDIVYVLTNGGPGYLTEVMSTTVFKDFAMGRYGIATAMASVLFIIMITTGFFLVRFLSPAEDLS